MKNKQFFNEVLPFWLSLVVAITLLCGFTYVAVQQAFRQGANDPQIQVAEDIAASLSQSGKLPALNQVTDIKKSLATFVTIYDNKGKMISTTAQLDNQTPDIPMGAFQYAQTHQENRITWQPQTGMRFAVVIVPFANHGGFIVAGRSLREVEKRVDQMTLFVVLTWVGAVFGSLLVLVSNKLLIKKLS